MVETLINSPEYDKLRADMLSRRSELVDEIIELPLSSSDKQMASKVRNAIADIRAIDAMLEKADGYFYKH